MAEKLNYRQASKTQWASTLLDGQNYPGLDIINAGSLMRIADASEAMAHNHIQLIKERDWNAKAIEHANEIIARLEKELATQKGLVTRYKNKVEFLKQNK